ncbi:MAG: SsrA-binding protein SmpB [Dissulfurispiraceae bacterium]|nr:SsrA-binding protein SmpB [Dissulfurispiraceae bacterium]
MRMILYLMKIVCQNRKAYHDYHIEETYEAGIALVGTEVKSLRAGKANLQDSYVILKDAEVFLLNAHISPYSHGNIMNHEPLRTRKLLLNRKEIERLRGKMIIKGYTLIPLKIYFKGSFAKVEVGLAKGKAKYEKRESIKEREAKREIDKAMKARKKE